MTQEEMNATIGEVIINTDKSKYKTNSYFRKYNENHRLKKRFNTKCYRFYQAGKGYISCGVYFDEAKSRFVKYYYSKRKRKTHKVQKKIFVSSIRRYKDELSNGRYFKKFHLKYTH